MFFFKKLVYSCSVCDIFFDKSKIRIIHYRCKCRKIAYKVYISYDSTRYYITGGLKVQGLGSEELTTIENENTVQ